MNCTVCGYAMSAFDSACPRCAQQKGSQPIQRAPENNWAQPASPHTQVAPPSQNGWTQPGQPPQAQPYHVPPQGYAPQQPGYPPQQPGYPPAYGQPVPASKGIHPVIIVVGVFFLLCSVPIVIAVLTMVGSKVSDTVERAPQTTSIQPAATPQIRTGPSFAEADSKMSSRQYQWTEAQQQAYWASVQGTRISWSGEITEVKTENGGTVMLKCNPKTFTFDVSVSLDGTQVDRLSTLSKGQRITIEGILDSHSTFGYAINQGRVTGL